MVPVLLDIDIPTSDAHVTKARGHRDEDLVPRLHLVLGGLAAAVVGVMNDHRVVLDQLGLREHLAAVVLALPHLFPRGLVFRAHDSSSRMRRKRPSGISSGSAGGPYGSSNGPLTNETSKWTECIETTFA